VLFIIQVIMLQLSPACRYTNLSEQISAHRFIRPKTPTIDIVMSMMQSICKITTQRQLSALLRSGQTNCQIERMAENPLCIILML